MPPRPSIRPVVRLVAIAILVILGSPGPLGAQTGDGGTGAPPLPPNRLDGAAASKIDELGRQSDRLMEAGRYAEAIAPAREVLEIRTRLQGTDHWQTAIVRYRLDLLEKLASLPAEGQRAMVKAYSEVRRAAALNERAQHREAEAIHRTVLESLRHWLGADHFATVPHLHETGHRSGKAGATSRSPAPVPAGPGDLPQDVGRGPPRDRVGLHAPRQQPGSSGA